MGELKFRAWDKANNEMYQVRTLEWDACINPATPAHTPVECIMQYTGVKDKNGTEIYEGDIIKWEHDTGMQNGTKEGGIFVVEWLGFPYFYNFEGVVNTETDCEVVGNIYNTSTLDGQSKTVPAAT